MSGQLRFDALVEVRLRPGIADPQGATIERALPALGFEGIGEVSTGKAIRLVIDAPDEADARRRVEDLCHRFLTNPVIEDAVVTLAVAAVPAPVAHPVDGGPAVGGTAGTTAPAETAP